MFVGEKKMWEKKCWGKKYLGKKMCGKKYFWKKKMCGKKKILETKIIWKKFLAKTERPRSFCQSKKTGYHENIFLQVNDVTSGFFSNLFRLHA